MQDESQKSKEKIVQSCNYIVETKNGHVEIKEEISDDFWIQLPPVILISSDDEFVLFSLTFSITIIKLYI